MEYIKFDTEGVVNVNEENWLQLLFEKFDPNISCFPFWSLKAEYDVVVTSEHLEIDKYTHLLFFEL